MFADVHTQQLEHNKGYCCFEQVSEEKAELAMILEGGLKEIYAMSIDSIRMWCCARCYDTRRQYTVNAVKAHVQEE